MKAAGLLAAGYVLPGMRVSLADIPGDKRFILYIARGAADGLSLIPPYGDKDYASARGHVALSAGQYAPLDGFFGAHQSLAAFAEMFRNGEASAIHAVATPYRERSHFDAQNVLENGGTVPNDEGKGWLNRLLALYGTRAKDMGLALGRTLPLILQGGVPVTTWAPSEQGLPGPEMLRALEEIYSGDALLKDALAGAVGLHGLIGSGDMQKPVAMPEKPMGKGGKLELDSVTFSSGSDTSLVPTRVAVRSAMSNIGRMMAAPKGPRIVAVDQGGWDTHTLQGTGEGLLSFYAGLLDETLFTLKASLGQEWKKTVVLVVTEFGRTVAPNGTGGTDHGTGFCAMLAGGAVAGGKVHGVWPGLAKDKLFAGRDLAPTTDLRSVIKGVLQAHLGINSMSDVFPSSNDIAPLEGLVKPG